MIVEFTANLKGQDWAAPEVGVGVVSEVKDFKM